jgi:hypothetical protein
VRCSAWGLENELDVFTVQLPSLWRNGNVPMVTWEVWPSKGIRRDVVAHSSGADSADVSRLSESCAALTLQPDRSNRTAPTKDSEREMQRNRNDAK